MWEIVNRKYQSVSWNAFEGHISNLVEKIWRGKYKYILAVTRGGLIPAYYIADKLWIRVVKTVCISSYTWNRKQSRLEEHTVDWFTEKINSPKDWLIVEDIVDTGISLQFLRKKFPWVSVASIFCKKNSWSRPDYFADQNELWVRFPWE